MSKTSKSALIELHYFPSVQYFSKFLLFDAVLIEQHENYQKVSYRNRCHIAGVNGVLRLSIPLQKGKNQSTPIREVKIAYNENWQSLHWSSIRSAYGKSPFFDHYADYIQPFFQQKPSYLFDWNQSLLSLLLKLIRIECPINLSTAYENELAPNVTDLRASIFPKKHRQKEDPFFSPTPYAQVFEEKHGFIPNLSILDLLFCTGPEAILILESSISKNGINQ